MSSNDSGSASHNVDLKDPFHQSSSSPFNVIDDENQSAVFPTTDDDTSESNSDNFTSLATSSSSLFPSSTTSSSQSTLNDGIQSASSTTTVSKIPERTEGETEFEPTVTAVDSMSIDTSQQVKTGKQSPAMLFGTIVIIGAVAANVIGFRHSRFAVGKDVHRAWKNHERAAGRRASSTSSSSSFEQQQQQAYRREQQQRERLERQRAAAAEAKEQVRRERVTRADREARDSSRQKYQTWEQRTYRNPDGSHTTTNTYNQETFGVEIDPALFEALFGNRNTNSRSKSQQDRNPFGMPEDVLEELLRAAQQQQADFHKQQQQQTRRSGSRTYRRVEDDFDAFRFWEQMNNAGAFGTNDFNHSGSGGGAGSRFAGMGGARTMGMNRFYSVLGLKQGASDAEIKAAYRKQVMKWHPDRYRGNNKEEAERKFREVTEAYNVLTGK